MEFTNKPRVLAVDDNVINLKLLTHILSNQYTFSVALDGQTALEVAKRLTPDIILMDIMMPGMDGYEVCTHLKADPVTAGIPVIFLTARHYLESEEHCFKVGAVDYLEKPFNPAVFIARVALHIELKRLRDNLEFYVDERTKELNAVKEGALLGIALLAESRDQGTGDHIWRTTNYMRVIAKTLSTRRPDLLPLSDIELVVSSAALHDIGKVGIPDAILLKPGVLTAEERSIMQQHPIIGAGVIKQMTRKLGTTSFLHYALDIVSFHHEKWDGSGYPFGLSGEKIPLSACAMALADVYDALVSPRVYKSAFTHEEAVQIILKGDERTKPSHFNPLILEIFEEEKDAFWKIAFENPS